MSEKQLRTGYTTGTCAAAAAKAAACFLLTGFRQDMAEVKLPSVQSAKLKVCGQKLEKTGGACADTPATESCYHTVNETDFDKPECAVSWVQKDAGDDPDVTHGALVYGSVREITEAELEEQRSHGNGYWLSEYPFLYLTGGAGIGMVTRPGLSCPPGHFAINPMPRRMILDAVDEVRREAGFDGYLLVQVSIPDGIRLAEQTFNPRLGIVNGISVLGTTGIVKPMSEEALLATIWLDIHMKAVDGERVLLMAPGNYGEAFLQEREGIPLGEAVLCSNFVRRAVGMAAAEGIRELLFVSHIGKLVKVSAGVENTHSKYGDGRMEQMSYLTSLVVSGKPELAGAVRSCNTTEEAVGLLKDCGESAAVQVLERAAEEAGTFLKAWSEGQCEIQVMTFSSAHGIVGMTKGAGAMLERWREQG